MGGPNAKKTSRPETAAHTVLEVLWRRKPLSSRLREACAVASRKVNIGITTGMAMYILSLKEAQNANAYFRQRRRRTKPQ